MKRHVTLDQVKRELRARACQHCPLRSPGQPGDRIDTDTPLDCEQACELFEQLPELTELAKQIDPMLRPVDQILQHRISQTLGNIARVSDADRRSSPLNRHRRCVVQTLTELVEQ